MCVVFSSIPSILTWRRRHLDHEGGSPKVRPSHCTSGWLYPYDSPKRGELGRIIYGSGGLRTRYPLILNKKIDLLIITTRLREVSESIKYGYYNVHAAEFGLL